MITGHKRRQENVTHDNNKRITQFKQTENWHIVIRIDEHIKVITILFQMFWELRMGKKGNKT
jgi:hypothetical protein